MKKNTQSNLAKNLAKYSALSLALAGISDATGQIVFVDVDPDFVGGMGDVFSMDIDQNGTDDFVLQQEGIITNVAVPVIGDSQGGIYYATNLEEGAMIGPTETFLPNGDLCYGGGFAYSFCQPQTAEDGIVGFSFDIDGDTHYGWARLLGVDAMNFTVAEFGYNENPGEPIPAGATTLSLSDNTIEGLSSFVANNALTINARNPIENVTIHNLSGQVVISNDSNNTTATIDLNSLSTGAYIASIQSEGITTAIKFVK